MYGANPKKKNIESACRQLNQLYREIPDTKGCMENINKPEDEGGCGAWCCQTQDPQVLYIEFLNTWNDISKSWTDDQLISLIENAIRKYVQTFRKGCVFWDSKSKLCSQHETRPYNCRIYGITPEEEFRPRYERLKVLYPETRDQCSLVSTADGSEVTKEDIDLWWKILTTAEKKAGVPAANIHDEFGGSYRRYHEHLLLHIFGEEGMEQLSMLRSSDDGMRKEKTIRVILSNLKSLLENKDGDPSNKDFDSIF